MTRLFMEPINAVSSALSAIGGPALRAGKLSLILGLLPSLAKGATAFGAAAIPAFTGLGTVIGLVRLMLGDMSKTIEELTLKRLTGMGSEIRKLAIETSKPGFNAFLAGVVKNGPLFLWYITHIAESLGQVGYQLAGLLHQPIFQGKLKKLLESTALGTRYWLFAIDAVVDMIVTLGSVAGPIFVRLAGNIMELAHRWRDWLNMKHETKELQQFMREAGEELFRWGRIFGNVIVGLHNIFAAGVGPSSDFAASLERITRSFRDWTEQSENVEKVRRVFQWMVDHVDDMFRVAAAATAIGVALKSISMAASIASFVQMSIAMGPVGVAALAIGASIATLAAGFFLAFNSSELFRAKVGEILTMLGERGLPILKELWAWFNEKIVPTLEYVATAVLDNLKGALSGLLTTLEDNKDGLKALGDVLRLLIPLAGAVALEIMSLALGALRFGIMQAGLLGKAIRGIPKVWSTVVSWFDNGIHRRAAEARQLITIIPRLWQTIYRFLPGGAISAIKGVISWIARIPKNVSTTFTSVTRNITESVTRFMNPFARASGGIVGAQGMQTGGLVGSRSVLVGEHGPELAELPFGSRVVPAGQTKAALAGAGHQGGGEPIVIHLTIGNRDLGEIVVDPLRKVVRSRGGSVQAVLGAG